MYQDTFALNAHDKYKTIAIPVEPLNNYQVENLNEFFKGSKKRLSILRNSYKNGVYFLTLKEIFKPLKAENVEAIVRQSVEAFERLNVEPQKNCVICGNENSNFKAKINRVLFHVHEECVDKARREFFNKEKEYAARETNYLKGVFGAIFGAVLGMIPWILISMNVGLYAAVFAILIGYLAFFFYKKFGGKVTPVTKYIISVITIAAVLGTNVFEAAYIILVNNAPLSMYNLGIVYSDPNLGPILYQDLTFGLIMGALGLITIIRKVKSEEFRTVIQ